MAPPTIYSLSPGTIVRICHHIVSRDDPEIVDIHRDLVSLALTNRSFGEPALGMLWHSLLSLTPLLRTLPEDLCAAAPIVYNGLNGSDPGKVGVQLVSVVSLVCTPHLLKPGIY